MRAPAQLRETAAGARCKHKPRLLDDPVVAIYNGQHLCLNSSVIFRYFPQSLPSKTTGQGCPFCFFRFLEAFRFA